MIKLIPEGFLLSDLNTGQRESYLGFATLLQQFNFYSLQDLKDQYEFWNNKMNYTLDLLSTIQKRQDSKSLDFMQQYTIESYNIMIIHKYGLRKRIEELEMAHPVEMLNKMGVCASHLNTKCL